MKMLPYILACSGIIALGFVSKNSVSVSKPESKMINGSFAPVAVLELFTSEGCSSCPPADRLIPELSKADSNIIALSFHVDYWDRLGWKDPFSKAEFTARQYKYVEQMNLQSAYTPQLVVNGKYELVGSNRSEALEVIQKALKEKTSVSLAVHDVKLNDKKLSFSISAEGEIKNTRLLAALIQQKAVTPVKAGENAGRTLSHYNVVRSLLAKDALALNSFEFTVPAELLPGNWQLVVYSQQKKDLKITGASVYPAQ